MSVLWCKSNIFFEMSYKIRGYVVFYICIFSYALFFKGGICVLCILCVVFLIIV